MSELLTRRIIILAGCQPLLTIQHVGEAICRLRRERLIAGISSTTATFVDQVSQTIHPFATFRTVNLTEMTPNTTGKVEEVTRWLPPRK
jgi:hypothetical protein